MAENNINLKNSYAETHNIINQNCEVSITTKPDSKTILRNMEEALNTVKENHRLKLRRRKEQKKLVAAALLEAEKVQSQQTDHESDDNNAKGEVENAELHEADMTPNKLANAFELMMKKRDKINDSPTSHTKEARSPKSLAVSQRNTKQKLVLQEWANQKGAKRRIEEENRAAFIEEELKTRAKRLKTMLLNETPSTSKRAYTRKKKNIDNGTHSLDSTLEPIDLSSKSKRGRSKKRNTNIEKSKTVTIENQTEETTTGRPRRSWVDKSSYNDADDENSLDVVIIENKNVEIIVVGSDDDSNHNTSVTTKSIQKLAPLFLHQKLDKDALKARQDFLHSGVPEKLRLEIFKQKEFEQAYENFQIFPKITHVQQFDNEEIKFMKQLFKRKSKIKITAEEVDDNTAEFNTFSKSINNIEKESTKKTFDIHYRLPIIENKRDIIKLWKGPFNSFQTYRCYNQLREKYHKALEDINAIQDSKQVTESFLLTSAIETHKIKLEEGNDKSTILNGKILLADKYKPSTIEEALINSGPVAQLHEFLANWSETRDETIDFDESNSNSFYKRNAVVVIGPSSTGKTSAVYALANEMNFNVLEINAGMKRTGKKILQELLEATQSHQIRKDDKVVKKLKRKKSMDKINVGANDRKSLILIEDADVVFEQTDNGFVDAIYTLAATSKRPVIIVSSNPLTSIHLKRLMDQKSIDFPMLNISNVAKLLAIIAIIENCPIAINDLKSIYAKNGQNLRKTLFDLHFYIHSGGDRTQNAYQTKNLIEYYAYPMKRSDISEYDLPVRDNIYVHRNFLNFYMNNQNIKAYIPSPIDFTLLSLNLDNIFASSKVMNKNIKLQKKKRYSEKVPNYSQTDIVSKFYNNISCATLIGCTKIDNVFGTNNTEFEIDRIIPRLSDEIAHYLVENSIIKQLNVDKFKYNLYDWTMHMELISDIFMMTAKQQRSLDYDPLLRHICRIEKGRAKVERRFHHYLRTISKLNNIELFHEAAEIFQEKT